MAHVSMSISPFRWPQPLPVSESYPRRVEPGPALTSYRVLVAPSKKLVR